MISKRYDIAIIGAGIIGCALARELAKRFRKVILIEKEKVLAFHTSGRNSGVLHSGFNQKPGTLKAKFCVEGNRLARIYCKERGIPYEEAGTYVVAAQEGQMLQLGVEIKLNQEVRRIQERSEGVYIETRDCSYITELVINCAGLYADRIAHWMGVGQEFTIAPFRGEYFETNGSCLRMVKGMIYPVPNPEFPFLGIHVTPTVHGTLILGPNAVLAFGREAYKHGSINLKDLFQIMGHGGLLKAFWKNASLRKAAWHELKNSCSKRHFLKEANNLVDGLKEEDFKLSKRVGIRAQLIRKNGDLVDDLIIERTARSIHILNVVSPGMTSALPFSKWLSEQISDDLCWKGEK